jgi:glycosyltransferase involved in cell wall biosynthesis
MRIVIIGPVYPYRGGIAHYTTQLADALDKSGIQHTVISFIRQYPSWLYPGESDKEPGESTLKTDALFTLDPLHPWTWIKTARQISKENPDLIVIQWWTTFWAPAFAFLGWLQKIAKRKITFIIHNVLPHEQQFWDKPLSKLALSSGYSYIIQTPREKERLIQLLPKAQIFECPLPVYKLSNAEKLSQSEAKEKLGVPIDEKLFIFFGLVRPYKGLGYLLEALEILHKQGVRPKLLIAGEFWEDKQTYLQMINQFQLNDQITIEDQYIPNERVELIFSAADCLVAPYVRGTQSGAASIALGFGLPMIVTTNVNEGIAEENKQSIQEVPPQDPEALANAIKDFLSLEKSMNNDRVPANDDWERLVQVLLRSRN